MKTPNPEGKPLRRKTVQKQILYTFLVLLCGLLPVYAGRELYAEQDPIRYTVLLYDYSMGFCSRFLVGDILWRFRDVYTEEFLDAVGRGAVLFAYACMAVLLGYVLRKANAENRKILWVLTLFALLFPLGVYQAHVPAIGMFDGYMMLIGMAAVACIPSRRLRWLVPPLCFLGLTVHYIFLLMYIPTIFSVLLYELAKKPKKDTLGLFAASFGVSFFGSIYYAIFANRTLTVGREEMFAYMESKLPGAQLYIDYLDVYFFNQYQGLSPDGPVDYVVFNMIWVMARVGEQGIYLWISMILAGSFFLLFPLVWALCCRRATHNTEKNSENRYIKWIYRLNLILPLSALPMFLLSPDYYRFIGCLFSGALILLFYYVYDENEDVLAALRSILRFCIKQPLAIVALAFGCLLLLRA